jgi:response regulator RpfG family c-di-GMP phosphodiesterase
VKRNFLIVATEGPFRDQLADDLRAEGFSVTLAVSGSETERIVKSVAVDMVLLGARLPDCSVVQIQKNIKQIRPECKVLPLGSLTGCTAVHDNPGFGSGSFLINRESLVELLRGTLQADQGDEDSSFAERGHQALIHVIDVLVGLHQLDDQFFGGSTHKVMLLAQAVAEEMSVDREMVREIMLGTLLRDIGNTTLDPDLFKSNCEFTREQSEFMQTHVKASLQLLEHIDFPWKTLPIIRHHHERYDGSGYPDGLRGREIPIGARIMNVVDSYVAMTSDRQHRKALEPEAALIELTTQAGTRYDPEIVDFFQRVVDKRLHWLGIKKEPRVLVIEQNDDFRKLLKMRLLNEGYVVSEAEGSAQGLELILKDAPSIILSDIDADSTETFQLLQELREDEQLCRTPVVLLSRRSDRVQKMRALRQGVDDYISKSTDMEELMARIENVLTREAIRHQGGRKKARRGISGSLDILSLPDLIQTLVIGMKTACITLNCDGNEGKIWMENGTLRHAQTGAQTGEQSFFEMMRWMAGEFHVEHRITTSERSIERDSMFLIMEGARLYDEDQANITKSA